MNITRTIAALLICVSVSLSAQDSYDWGRIEYKGKPWVENTSRPIDISKGLANRHIALWASHGRYYDQTKGSWKWQRPNLFCTTEDLFTQTIVVPYLIPMLENAGAVVFTPRERDWQENEIIVDNDDKASASYIEVDMSKKWKNAEGSGFAQSYGVLHDGDNPFARGTARCVKSTKSEKKASLISYQPDFPEDGRYSVYVSYKSLPKSVEDAQYTVYHKGQTTSFSVNQKMGGGTWVYLGTFDFDKGSSQFNRVVITNKTGKKGIVSSDAVRFGGGKGNIERGGSTSGLPRCIEGARYYAQWAGAPYSVYSSFKGKDDYKDDMNSRSLMTNWLAGGSCFMPDTVGNKVPIELSLAVHSDAGVGKAGGLIGTLTICTTDNNGKQTLASGKSRKMSERFANILLDNVSKDIADAFGKWNKRAVWNKNYSETRRPEVPSAIIEMLSHQCFADMKYGHDPNFKFAMARSIYKSILQFISYSHKESYAVQPLAPEKFSITTKSNGKAVLRWSPCDDMREQTAKATSYNVYIATNNSGFDNGNNTKNTKYEIPLEPGVLYRFKVTACNSGGESFPTEELAALYNPKASDNILIVNGFHRLSGPAVVDNGSQQGFDLNADAGVSYGRTIGWAGVQECFDMSQAGKEGKGALGYCGSEMEGKFVAGNDFNYVTTHAQAIQSAKSYNISSCSSMAVESGDVRMSDFNVADIILGLEKNDPNSLGYYKTFSHSMQQHLRNYVSGGGRIFVSGAYVGSDMANEEERNFLADVLRISPDGRLRNNGGMVMGLGMNFGFHDKLNDKHYAATTSDIISPLGNAYCAMKYSNETSAAIAYKGERYRAFTMGFPFECIKDASTRASIMRGIMAFLLK